MKHSLRQTTRPHHTALDRLFRYAEFLNFGEIYIKFDHATGLKAIIAIHNLKRGAGLGGCRLMNYPTADDALEDVLRLSYMMSLKAAVSNIPHGGAKAVIIKPKHFRNKQALLKAFAEFVNELDGRYITAVDSGTTPEDMDVIAEKTPFVTCTTTQGAESDPSIPTAFGVRRAIEAVVKYKLGRDSLEGTHVAIQGAGHVGYHLAKELTALRCRITMCDINPSVLQRSIDEFKVHVCSPEVIYDVPADVFAPCALGSVLNLETIKRLKVPIVAGSANNQLSHHHQGIVLREHGILYAPDFVINAGGLIYAAAMYDHSDPDIAREHVSNIYYTLMDILERSEKEDRVPVEIAEGIAMERLR